MSEKTGVSSAGVPDSNDDAPRRAVRPWRRVFALAGGLAVLGVLAVAACVAWTWTGSAGHRFAAVSSAPDAPVAIVFGAELRPDGRPKAFLASRLDTAAAAYRAGRVRALLVSGDGGGKSGDEVTSMARYLGARGVPAARIVADPHGLDTYDTCARAYQVFGVRRALVVTQDFHVPRAVTLCRHAGIDADGLSERCDDCTEAKLWRNRLREIPAAVKAAADALRDRRPAVVSPRDSAVDKALSS